MYTNILHATDLNTEHFSICEKAVKIAKKLNAKLYLLHVIEPPASLQIAQGLGFAEFAKPQKEDAQLVLATLGEAIGISLEQQYVEVGSIKQHIIEKMASLECTLLILGKHTHSLLPHFLANSAHHLEEHLKCDVLVLGADQ